MFYVSCLILHELDQQLIYMFIDFSYLNLKLIKLRILSFDRFVIDFSSEKSFYDYRISLGEDLVHCSILDYDFVPPCLREWRPFLSLYLIWTLFDITWSDVTSLLPRPSPLSVAEPSVIR